MFLFDWLLQIIDDPEPIGSLLGWLLSLFS